jgi:carbon-monoxide dehydrogenase medium subunit
MQPFDYMRAARLDEAIAMLRSDPDAKILAGGQTLLPAWKHGLNAPSMLIDIQDLPDLSGIADSCNTISFGAMTRHATVARLPHHEGSSKALSVLAAGIADPQVRNLGTIGGSIANNDPAADYPAAVLGLGATVITDRREIPADSFFTGLFETALEPDEIVTSVRFPKVRSAGYVKVANPASGYVTVGAFVADFGDHVRVAINGARACVYRDEDCERLLSRQLTPDALRDYSPVYGDFNDDLFASADYRAYLIPRVIARAVSRMATADQ